MSRTVFLLMQKKALNHILQDQCQSRMGKLRVGYWDWQGAKKMRLPGTCLQKSRSIFLLPIHVLLRRRTTSYKKKNKEILMMPSLEPGFREVNFVVFWWEFISRFVIDGLMLLLEKKNRVVKCNGFGWRRRKIAPILMATSLFLFVRYLVGSRYTEVGGGSSTVQIIELVWSIIWRILLREFQTRFLTSVEMRVFLWI